MIVTNQPFTQETFNDAFVSKISDSSMEGKLVVNNTTDSTSPMDGALHLKGGVGIEKSLNVGGTFTASGFIRSSQDGIVAHAGGGQADATQLSKEYNRIVTVATAGDSVKLPLAKKGIQVFVQNDGASSLNVFPSSGESIDIMSVDSPFVIKVSQKNAIFVCPTDGIWKTVSGGGAGGGVLSVADTTARDAIASGDRYVGLIVFVADIKQNFQLKAGITNTDWDHLDVGLVVTSVQTLSSGNITLLPVKRQRVKVKSSGGDVLVTLPNGTIDGQIVIVQGDDDSNTCSIASGSNVFQNGDVITFTKFYNVTYCWDLTNTMWVQTGGI